MKEASWEVRAQWVPHKGSLQTVWSRIQAAEGGPKQKEQFLYPLSLIMGRWETHSVVPDWGSVEVRIASQS
jgi:hypothetical protein